MMMNQPNQETEDVGIGVPRDGLQPVSIVIYKGESPRVVAHGPRNTMRLNLLSAEEKKMRDVDPAE